MSFSNLRPGVYSNYTVSSRYATPRSQQGAGLVCKGDPALAGVVLEITNREEIPDLLGTAHSLASVCTKILLESGVGRVFISMVDSDYADAIQRLELVDNIGIVLCDGGISDNVLAVLESVILSSESHRERLLFFGEQTPDKAVATASVLNSPRCAVTCGSGIYEENGKQYLHPLYVAAALAGIILSGNQAVINLNGVVLPLLTGITEPLKERDIQSLLAKGVTPVEVIGDTVQCVRGVTTKTTQGGVADTTMRSINTTLIVDEVLQTIRGALGAKLKGANQMATSLDSIASQVTVELAAKKEQGLLADYQAPRVYSDPTDPEVCIVELAFHVAFVISQIHIKAHVRL